MISLLVQLVSGIHQTLSDDFKFYGVHAEINTCSIVQLLSILIYIVATG